MALFTVLLSILLSFFSTTVMSYISMATPIGPWIAPTLMLIMIGIGLILGRFFSQEEILLPVISGSIGGIMATACGFSFPTLYFLNPPLFQSWLEQPVFFIATLSFLTGVSGLLAFWLVDQVGAYIVEQQDLPFPIARLVYGMVDQKDQASQVRYLTIGCLVSCVVGIFHHGIGSTPGLIPSIIHVTRGLQFGIMQIPVFIIDLDIAPMLLAIGFVTGHVIAIPLLVGVVSRIFLVDPCAQLLFSSLSVTEVSMAFCSGMVLIGAATDLFLVFRQSMRGVGKQLGSNGLRNKVAQLILSVQLFDLAKLGGLFLLIAVGLSYFSFSFTTSVYLVIATVVASYQMSIIAAKVGLAYLGRFATFIMVPAMFLFSVDAVQIVFIAAIVELCGGMTVDMLCGRKIGKLARIDLAKVRNYQMLGLFVSSLLIGFLFFHLISTCGLGSGQLFAYKAQSRHLLIAARCFDYKLLFLGALFGWFLKRMRINPGLVLGGLLMPITSSIILIVGGLGALYCNKTEKGTSFWSGVFAANSLWIVVHALKK